MGDLNTIRNINISTDWKKYYNQFISSLKPLVIENCKSIMRKCKVLAEEIFCSSSWLNAL